MKPSDQLPETQQPLLRRMFDAAIASAQPALCIPAHLPDPQTLGTGRLVVIGAGKASAAMARAVEDHWSGPLTGLVVHGPINAYCQLKTFRAPFIVLH